MNKSQYTISLLAEQELVLCVNKTVYISVSVSRNHRVFIVAYLKGLIQKISKAQP